MSKRLPANISVDAPIFGWLAIGRQAVTSNLPGQSQTQALGRVSAKFCAWRNLRRSLPLHAFLPLLVLSLVTAGMSQAQEVSPERRQFLNACATCHAAEKGAPHRQGPTLFGVFGKPAAQLEGFKYSEALKTSGFVWDEATLDAWLTDSQGKRPGAIMLYKQANPERRKLAIDYLKSLQ